MDGAICVIPLIVTATLAGGPLGILVAAGLFAVGGIAAKGHVKAGAKSIVGKVIGSELTENLKKTERIMNCWLSLCADRRRCMF